MYIIIYDSMLRVDFSNLEKSHFIKLTIKVDEKKKNQMKKLYM